MKTRRFASKVAALLTALLLVTTLMAVPVLAMGDPGNDDGGATGGTGTAPGTSTSESLRVTGYEVFQYGANGERNIPTQITEGMAFDLELKVFDSRAIVVKGEKQWLQPTLRINTSAFTRHRDLKNDGYPNSDFYVKNGGTGPNYGIETVNEEGNSQLGVVYTYVVPLVYTGKGNAISFDLFYAGLSSVAVSNYSLALEQSVERAESDSTSDSSETVTRGTGFVLQSASYGQSDIEAGKPFALDATLLATNGDYRVENASVTVALPKEVKLANGSSVSYIGTVKPNQAVGVQFQLTTNANVEEGSYVLTLKINGISAKDGTPVEAAADITIPVVQPERFEISNVRAPETADVGMNNGNGYGSLDLVNKGIGSVYNVEVEVTGDGVYTEEGKQYIGTIAGGGQNSVDFNVLAEMEGAFDAQVVVSYENARGEAKTLTHDFSVTAMDMMGGGDWGEGGMEPMPMPEETGGGIPVWVWLIVGVVVIAGVVLVVVVIGRRNKAKRDAELEEDLDDDDIYTPPPAPPAAPAQTPGGSHETI